MFLISQVESIGHLKNVDVNENVENSVSILFHIKSIKPLYYPHCIHKTMIYFIFFPLKIRISTIVSMAFLSRF